MDPTTTSTVSQLISDHGLAVALVIVGIVAGVAAITAGWLAGRQLAGWVGVQLVVPMRDAILGHISKVNGAIVQFADNDAKQTAILDRMDERLSRMDDRLDFLEDGMRNVGCPVIHAMPSRRAPEAAADAKRPQ